MDVFNRFLRWFPAWVVGVVGTAGGALLAAASVWPKVKALAERWWSEAVEVITFPAFLPMLVIIFALWTALIWFTRPNRRPAVALGEAIETAARRPAPETSPATSDGGLDLELTTSSKVENEHVILGLHARAKSRLTNVAVVARHATVEHYLTGASWKWSPSKRLSEHETFYPGEELRIPIGGRACLPRPDMIILGGRAVDYEPEELEGGLIAMFEVVVTCDQGRTVWRRIFLFMGGPRVRPIHVLDQEPLAYIQDS